MQRLLAADVLAEQKQAGVPVARALEANADVQVACAVACEDVPRSSSARRGYAHDRARFGVVREVGDQEGGVGCGGLRIFSGGCGVARYAGGFAVCRPRRESGGLFVQRCRLKLYLCSQRLLGRQGCTRVTRGCCASDGTTLQGYVNEVRPGRHEAVRAT